MGDDVNGGNPLLENEYDIEFDTKFVGASPTRKGYSFSGWYYNNNIVKNGIWKIDNDVTLTARWIPNQYQVTKHNGTNEGNQTITFDSNFNLGTSSKTGFDFNGYYSGQNGTGTQYTDKNGDSLGVYSDDKNIDLYAYFTYTIKFVSNGGSYVPDLTLNEDECLSEKIVSEKNERTFGGWFTDVELTKQFDYSKPSGNITLYAKWNEEIQPTALLYSNIQDGIKITGTTFTGSNFIIPSHIGGNPVIEISDNAFQGITTARNLFVPETVTSIGVGAFKGFDSLETITLPFVGHSMATTRAEEQVFGYIFGHTSCESSSNPYYTLTSSGKGTIQGSCYRSYGTINKTYCYYVYGIPELLKNVTITVQTAIPNNAFRNCDLLENINFVTYATLGTNAILNCNATIEYNYVPSTSAPWNGTSIATSYHGGTGTKEDPYQIFTAEEFIYFISSINNGENYSNTYFILTSNINFGGFSISQISFMESNAFAGELDGNGKTISNFSVDCTNTEYIGLFGYVSGMLKNFNITSADINLNLDDSNTHYGGFLVGI